MTLNEPSKAPTRRKRIGGLWRSLLPYVGTRRWRLVALVGLSLVSGFAEAALMFMIVQVAVRIAAGHGRINEHLGPFGHVQLTPPAVLGLAACVLAVLFAVVFINALVAARMSGEAMKRARNDMVAAFVDTSWRVQSREREGRLQELLSNHAERIGAGVVMLSTGLNALVVLGALLVSAVAISPFAAAFILVGVVLIYLLLSPLTRATRSRSHRQIRLNTDYALHTTELVGLAREVRVFDVGSQLQDDLAERAAEAARSHVITRLLARLTPNLYQYSALALVLGGMAAVYGLETGNVANLGAVVLLLVRALSYSQQVNVAIQQAVEISPYIEELEGQLSMYRADRVNREGRALPVVNRLAFEEVRFSYEPKLPVLEGVSFEVDAGAVVGIIGPSGGGKSTLVQILLRLRAPDAGRFVVNDEDAAAYALGDWYRRFAFVPQDNRLLRGTVADNIRFHRPYLDRSDIEQAARAAHLHEDILRWPMGYETVIGSGEMDISGGQRQRLGLARALAGQPSVLVLDEPTSALDMRSEAFVQTTLQELKGKLTLFIVAHRMSTLNICDRIMVLDHGRLQAFGTREELRESSAFFAEVTRLARPPA